MNHMPSKTMPKHCGKSMHRMYIRKGTEKRKWIPVGYFCDICSGMFRKVDLMKKREIDEVFKKFENLVEFEKDPRAVVIDLGSSMTKVGVAGESKPRFIFDTAIYYNEAGKSFIRKANYQDPKNISVRTDNIFQDIENFEEEINLDTLELFFKHIFDELKIKPEDLPVLIVNQLLDHMSLDFLKGNAEVVNDSSLPSNAKELLLAEKPVKYVHRSPRLNALKRKLALVLFDRLNISELYFSFEEILSIYANESVTGVIVSLGNQSTRITPIYEGYVISHATNFRSVGAKDVVNIVKKEVINQGMSMRSSVEDQDTMQKNIRIASEELCYVSIDPSVEDNKWNNSDKLARSFRLIDNDFISLEKTRYQAVEALFRNEPLSITKELGNLAEAVVESIQKCDRDLAKDLYSNIILTGGASKYEGFLERFTREIRMVAPQNIEINVSLSTTSISSGWTGGSIITSIDIFYDRKLWITKEEYDEKGSSVVERCI